MMLGGSWYLLRSVIIVIRMVVTSFRVPRTELTSVHEPPSMVRV